MKQSLLIVIALCSFTPSLSAQEKPAAPASTQPAPQKPQPFDLAEYGVAFEAEPRLIIMMAALDAAGYDPVPPGREPSAFRGLLRKDQAGLDPTLRERLHSFYERNKLPAPATAADQAARYISLAYVLGPPPLLDPPDRSDDLPGGVLDVLDFAPLVREFYKKSGIDERLVSYVRAYQAAGERMRQPTSEMVRAVLSFLHTRPITEMTERLRVKSPDKKKNAPVTYTTRQRERRFLIVPDLLATPGTINFRVIGDDYYAIVPEGTDPAFSETRRAYLQYVIDPLMMRFNKEIAARREQVKQLIDAGTKEGNDASTDVFQTVSRSLVAAADARFEAAIRLAMLTNRQRLNLHRAKNDAERAEIAKEAQGARAAIEDEAVGRLSEDYEKGALLDFYFAEQLHDVEVSGFDIANFFPDMIAAFDPVRETKRPVEAAAARNRATAARKAHPRYSLWLVDPGAEANDEADNGRASALIKSLTEVEKLLETRNYEEAETKLRALLEDHPRDPRILFTLGQTASLWARDSTDDALQVQRLQRALASYRLAVAGASPETDRALISHAHEAMGRILAFLDRSDEAMKEFEATIRMGDVSGGAYKDAVEGKRKLSTP
jgi:hypothetical protein